MSEGFRELRVEMSGETGGLRAEMHADSRALWSEVAASRRWLVTLQVTMILGFVAVLIQLNLR